MIRVGFLEPPSEGDRLQQWPDITGINHHASSLLSMMPTELQSVTEQLQTMLKGLPLGACASLAGCLAFRLCIFNSTKPVCLPPWQR